jgi:hypothetical protein
MAGESLIAGGKLLTIRFRIAVPDDARPLESKRKFPTEEIL